MKKLAILASLFMVMTSFVYSEPANAICGQQAIRFDGNQRAGDDEFLWLNNADYQRAGGKMGKFEGVPGFECDDEGCTNLSLIEMPAGHCFNGNCNTSEAVYRCSIGGNDKWVNIGTIRDCTEAELVNKRTLSERGMTDTTVLIANTNTANTTKYAWVGINNGYICRIKSGSQITPSVKCTHGGKQYNPGETVNCYESQAAFNATGATKATKKCLNTGQWSSCNHICPTNKPVFSGGKCIARSNNTVVKPPVQEVPEVESKCNCDERQLANLAAIEVKYEFIYKANMSDSLALEIANLARKIINNCDEKTCSHVVDIARLNALVREYENRISQQASADAAIQAGRDAAIEAERTRLRQQSYTNATNSIRNTFTQITSMQSGFDVSVWKNAEGNFNTSRLISDSVAGVVLGTAGGLITSNVIKKNQVSNGFEDLSCTVGGQVVAGWDDQFSVGIR